MRLMPKISAKVERDGIEVEHSATWLAEDFNSNASSR